MWHAYIAVDLQTDMTDKEHAFCVDTGYEEEGHARLPW